MGDSNTNLYSITGLVVFCLHDKLFCANINDVFAIVNPADYPKNFKNSYLINSHLEIENLSISVIDLHTLFGLQKSKITETSRFLSMDIAGQAFGFLADKVEEVISLNPESTQKFKFIKSSGEKYLSGKVKHNDDVFYLPNFKKIINESFVHY